MKKLLIGAFVGSVLLFILQFLSWGALNLHGNESTYTEKQDTIMQILSKNLTEGSYMLPMTQNGASKEDVEKLMKDSEGKPWAVIQYHESMKADMGMNMFRGLLVDLIAVLLLGWLLLKFSNLNFQTSVLVSMAVGFIGYFSVTYTHSIWFKESTLMYLVDMIIQWGVVGSWLGWWFTRK
jgi:hypothetical protein